LNDARYAVSQAIFRIAFGMVFRNLGMYCQITYYIRAESINGFIYELDESVNSVDARLNIIMDSARPQPRLLQTFQ